MKTLTTLLAASLLMTPAYAGQAWYETFGQPSKPKVERPYRPKAARKPAPPPAVENMVDTTQADLQVVEGPYVALFTKSHQLWWTGKITGSLRIVGDARSQYVMTARCETETTPCSRWVLTEQVGETRPAARTSYVTFRVNDRLIVWPHTVMLSNKPFDFNMTPVLESW